MEVCPRDTVRVFTDGSKLKDGRTGWGYALYHAGTLQRRGLGSIGTKAEVYDAEIRGTLEGINEANRFLGTINASKVEILLDNHAAA